jgi:predicted transcriptional regulator of viral defense system
VLRIRRGLYAIPSKLQLGGRWNPGEPYSLNALISEQGGRYQVTGPNAFYRYGWTEQIPNRIYAYNNRISGERQVGAVNLTLIKINPQRLGDTDTVKTPDGLTIVYSSKARAMVDAVSDWAKFNTLPQAYEWIAKELGKDEAFAGELIESAARYGNQGTIRRIGAALELLGVVDSLLRKLERALKPTQSFIPFVPNKPKRGTAARGQKTNKRWGIVINA